MRCTSPEDAHPACGDNELVRIRAARVTELHFMQTIDRAAGCRLPLSGSEGGLLALQAAHFERQKDVGEAPEQREEPDPDEQQQRLGGELLLGDPEAEQDL